MRLTLLLSAIAVLQENFFQATQECVAFCLYMLYIVYMPLWAAGSRTRKVGELKMLMILIPEIRHDSIQYGAFWSNQMGQSGHYIRSNGRQKFVQAQERRDLSWGTEREAQKDPRQTTVTLAEIRKAIQAAQ